MRRVKWTSGVPAEIKRAAEGLFKRYNPILPTWCHWLTIEYGDTKDAPMTCDAQPEYRQATITLGQGWLAEEEEAREIAVCHEHVHVTLAPMANFVERLLKLVPDNSGKAVIRAQWDDAVEGVTCDIAALLYDRNQRGTRGR